MKLPKEMTMAERRILYANVINAPTTDREASRMPRVVWLYRELPRIKPQKILDIGCESGFVTRWVVDEPYVKSYLGIDPCPFCIDHAKELIKKRQNPQKAEYSINGWEDQLVNKYNAIICFEIIEHFLPEEGVQLIEKIDSLLEPLGTAFLCTPSYDGAFGASNPDKHHLKIYTKDELDTLVKNITGVNPEFVEKDKNFSLLKWRKRLVTL